MTTAILLVVASLALFTLEVFVVSFGALTLAAVALGIGGIVAAFNVSTAFGWTMTGVVIVGIPACIWSAFKLLPKLPFARGFYLEHPNRSERERSAAAAIDESLVGREGISVSALRPAGAAEIDGQPMQVISKGTLIDAGTPVRVVDVSGNRIVVEEIES